MSDAVVERALALLLERAEPVGVETVALDQCVGRVLAQAVATDRDSPACDVSAMDGYAVRLADVAAGELPVAGEATIGRGPMQLPQGRAMRIFTGGPVPPGAEAVVRREDTQESPDRVRFTVAADAIRPGQNVRRRGENARTGAIVLQPGTWITPAAVGAMATFGAANPTVYRRVRVAIITTGDEVRGPSDSVTPWEIRNSNGPVLDAMVTATPWLERVSVAHAIDDRQQIESALRAALTDADTVLLTGGVSMGDHDHVPDVVRSVGAEVIFHRLPIRPGKPILGAIASTGQPIFGLPGNPVSVLVTARRFALPTLAKRAGLLQWPMADAMVRLTNPDKRTIDLVWHRPVCLVDAAQAELIDTRGSGDVAAVGATDGFVELPRGQSGPGPWPFYRWSVA